MESMIESSEIANLKVDFVNNIEGAVRRHGVIDIKDGGQSKDVIGAAFRVHFENLPENSFPTGLTGKLVEAAARVETVRQQCTRLEPKQKEFAGGLVDNLLGAYAFVSELPDKMRDVLPTKGKWPILAVEAGLMFELATACTKPVSADSVTVTPTRPVAAEFTKTPLTSPTVSYATETPFVPTITTTPIPTETQTPTEVVQETIDLPLSDGETITVKEFESSQDAENYVAKNTRWYTGSVNYKSWVDNIFSNGENSSYLKGKVWKAGIESHDPPFLTLPSSSKSFFYINLDELNNMSTILYQKKDGTVEFLIVNVAPSDFERYVENNPPPTPTPTQ